MIDFVTLGGLILGLAGIVGGMILEGGHLSAIIQGTAAVIVFGGTLGAVLVSTTREDLKTGLSLLKLGFWEGENENPNKLISELIEASKIVRKDSLLVLERRLGAFSHPFMQNVFRFVVDGVEPHVLREIFEAQLALEEENEMAGAKIFTDAGGYAPTIGIIGAVLGLIHVMSNLSDTSQLGAGIAVAFVATVYGVGSANLVFLPLANKIKRKIRRRLEIKEMILEGAVSVMSGVSPFIMEEKLRSYVVGGRSPKSRISEAA